MIKYCSALLSSGMPIFQESAYAAFGGGSNFFYSFYSDQPVCVSDFRKIAQYK
jgi:hypothetical protein